MPAHPFGGHHHSKSEARSPCVRHAGHVTKGDFRFKTRVRGVRLNQHQPQHQDICKIHSHQGRF